MARVGAVLLLLLGAVFVQTHAQLLQGAQPGATIAPAAAGASAANPCALGITFFPPGADNKPTGWTQPAQANVGNTASDQMVKTALAGYPVPMLYMAPVSVFTQVNGAVPGQCMGGTVDGVLTKPAHFTITWALAGAGGVIGPFTKGSKQDPPANVTLSAVPDIPDGDYCLQLKMDVVPGSGSAAVGTQMVPVPSAPQSITRQVCFIKMASRPTANVTFHSCNTSFAVDLMGITPKPMFANPQLPLFSTVFHVWGKLNRTFDRSPQADNLLDYFDQYVKWSDPASPPFLQVLMESPGLLNGYYNVWIEGSLSTTYPDLVSLFGLDQYDDGSAKYMGVSLRNSSNRPVPIQTVRSKIADLAGPDIPVQMGQAATFTWETQGYGEQFCYVDGQKVANTADVVHCESPLNLKVADNANHTLEVMLVDVCGEVVANGIFFGSWGWRQNMKFVPPPPPPTAPDAIYNDSGMPLPVRTPMVRNRTTSAAASNAAAGGVVAMLAGFLGMLLI
eukprot:GHRQ01004630.1.p1 GENE.GHRQ01004630.1~~GHRQ01004630.1.p1  ORF type:complete len:505 (+),score=154.95 GHRQ01004630.1:71-1585(+)